MPGAVLPCAPMDASEDKFQLIETTISQAKHPGRRAIPLPNKMRDGFSRQDVVEAFQHAFEIIGGTSRLALWANANPERFYPLYTKLLPATTLQLGAGATVVVQHALPPGPLDQHPGFASPEEQAVPRGNP